MLQSIKHFIIILSITGLLLPVFAVADTMDKPISPPGSFGEVFTGLKKVLEFFPNIVAKIWQGIIRNFQKVFRFFGNIWDRYILPKLEWMWVKIASIFGKEVEKRKEAIPGELKKEKQEMKTEAKESGKGIWQKIKYIVTWI